MTSPPGLNWQCCTSGFCLTDLHGLFFRKLLLIRPGPRKENLWDGAGFLRAGRKPFLLRKKQYQSSEWASFEMTGSWGEASWINWVSKAYRKTFRRRGICLDPAGRASNTSRVCGLWQSLLPPHPPPYTPECQAPKIILSGIATALCGQPSQNPRSATILSHRLRWYYTVSVFLTSRSRTRILMKLLQFRDTSR